MRRWILIFSICLLQGCVDGDTDRMVEGVKASEEVPDGLSQSDWAGIRKAHRADRHRFVPLAGEAGVWQARNPGQGFVGLTPIRLQL